MRYTEQSLPVGVVASAWPALDVDVLVVPVFEGEAPPAVAVLDGVTGGRITASIEGREFAAKPNAMFITPAGAPDWRPARVMLIGLGKRADV